jgi:hypothetical protein
MTDKKQETILICWNSGVLCNHIEAQVNKIPSFKAILCPNQSKFFELNSDLSKLTYIIVLCELTWSDTIEKNGAYSDMNGIRLAQHLRRDKDIKVPILFVSFLSRKMILDKYPDAEIICTPALKHEFCQLPSKPEEWIEKLNNLNGKLTNLELKYTQRRFCSIVGLLEHINHDISKCATKDELNEKLKVLIFANKGMLHNSKSEIDELEKKINSSTEENFKDEEYRQKIHHTFKKICKQIKDSINGSSIDNNQQSNEKQPNILFIDDDFETDDRIKKLIKAMQNQGFQVTAKDTPIYDMKKIRTGKWGIPAAFGVIICDIEINEKSADGLKNLTHLGFNYIKWLEGKSLDRIFIILSNVTRNLYYDIIFDNNNTKNVYLFQKDVYICSDAARQEFISKVKDLIEDKNKNKQSKAKGKHDPNAVPIQYFRNYINFLKNDSNYVGNKIPEQFKNYQDVIQYVKSKTEEVQKKISLNETSFFTYTYQYRKGESWECNDNRIANFIQDKVGAIGNKKPKKPRYSFCHSKNFINTLIARRLLIFMLLKTASKTDDLFEESQNQYPQSQYCFPNSISRQLIITETDHQKDKEEYIFSAEEVAYINELLNKE